MNTRSRITLHEIDCRIRGVEQPLDALQRCEGAGFDLSVFTLEFMDRVRHASERLPFDMHARLYDLMLLGNQKTQAVTSKSVSAAYESLVGKKLCNPRARVNKLVRRYPAMFTEKGVTTHGPVAYNYEIPYELAAMCYAIRRLITGKEDVTEKSGGVARRCSQLALLKRIEKASASKARNERFRSFCL